MKTENVFSNQPDPILVQWDKKLVCR